MHRRTGENRWKEAGGPASSSLLTAVRLCVCFLLAILLAVRGAVAQLGEHLVCNGKAGLSSRAELGIPGHSPLNILVFSRSGRMPQISMRVLTLLVSTVVGITPLAAQDSPRWEYS